MASGWLKVRFCPILLVRSNPFRQMYVRDSISSSIVSADNDEMLYLFELRRTDPRHIE
jgi:hypothetical protein